MGDEGEIQGVERWFDSVSLTPPVSVPASSVGLELVRMLDALQPPMADPSSSWIRMKSSGLGRKVSLHVAHQLDPWGGVAVDILKEGAVVSWLGTHEHIDVGDGSAGRPWTVVVADVVAAVLRGEYAVETVTRFGRVVRTRVIDEARGGAVISETGSLLGWLPVGRRQTVTRRLDFGFER